MLSKHLKPAFDDVSMADNERSYALSPADDALPFKRSHRLTQMSPG
jgi:hypothetical protein